MMRHLPVFRYMIIFKLSVKSISIFYYKKNFQKEMKVAEECIYTSIMSENFIMNVSIDLNEGRMERAFDS